MSESPTPPTSRLVRLFAILNSRTEGPGVDLAMLPAIQSARRLRNLLFGILVVSFLHAIWAQFIAGIDLPLEPVALRGGVEREKASVTLHLTPEMNPVQLLFQRRTDLRYSIDYFITVRDAEGQVIETEFTGDYGMADPPAESGPRKARLGLFDVPADGDYVVEVEAVQRDTPIAIHDAAVGVRRDAAESHFLLTLLLWPFAVGMAVKWWRRQHGWVWDELTPAEAPAPPPEEPAAAPAAGPSRLRLSRVLDSAPAVPEPPPIAVAPAAEPVGEKSLLDRIRTRVSFEGLSLLLTAAQVPLVGAYTMVALIAVLSALGGASPATLDAVMRSPVTERIAKWFFPAGKYEGFAALWAMGQAGGVVVIGFHLLMLPLRLLRSGGPRWSYRQKLKLLLRFSMLGAIAGGVVSFLPKQDFGEAIKGLTIYGLLLAFLFVPAAVMLAITTKLQQMIDAAYPPDEPPAS